MEAVEKDDKLTGAQIVRKVIQEMNSNGCGELFKRRDWTDWLAWLSFEEVFLRNDDIRRIFNDDLAKQNIVLNFDEFVDQFQKLPEGPDDDLFVTFKLRPRKRKRRETSLFLCDYERRDCKLRYVAFGVLREFYQYYKEILSPLARWEVKPTGLPMSGTKVLGLYPRTRHTVGKNQEVSGLLGRIAQVDTMLLEMLAKHNYPSIWGNMGPMYGPLCLANHSCASNFFFDFADGPCTAALTPPLTYERRLVLLYKPENGPEEATLFPENDPDVGPGLQELFVNYFGVDRERDLFFACVCWVCRPTCSRCNKLVRDQHGKWCICITQQDDDCIAIDGPVKLESGHSVVSGSSRPSSETPLSGSVRKDPPSPLSRVVSSTAAKSSPPNRKPSTSSSIVEPPAKKRDLGNGVTERQGNPQKEMPPDVVDLDSIEIDYTALQRLESRMEFENLHSKN